MITTKEVRICDNCRNEAFEDAHNPHFGGSPFSGWLQVRVTNGSTTLEALAAQKEFDFCSKKCLREWCDE